MTYEEIRQKMKKASADVEYKLLREALEKNAWVLLKTSEELECAQSTLHAAIQRHPQLARKIRAPGRPTDRARARRATK